MAMSQATLSTGLQTLVPTADEAVAAQRLADAWQTYFSAAAAGPPFSGATGAKSAFQAALSGMSAPGAGALAIQNAIVAFWAAIVAAPATYFAGVTVVTPPPGITTIAAALAPVMAANTAANAGLATACDNFAAVIHPLNLGGLATIPPAPPAPIA